MQCKILIYNLILDCPSQTCLSDRSRLQIPPRAPPLGCWSEIFHSVFPFHRQHKNWSHRCVLLMTWLLSLLSTWLSFQIVTSCASMDHCVPGWRQCGKAQDQARWKLVPLIEPLKGENDFSEDSQKEAKDLSVVFCPSPDQLFSRISPLLQSTTIRQTVHLEKYGNHYLALLSISGIFDISPQQPHPLKDEYRCGKYTYKRCALAPQLCLWTVIFPLKLSFLYIREGVKKNGFLGLCPRHRTPPTHRACLGLH